MKRLNAGLVTMALVALSGCTQGTPGGPGTTATHGTTTTASKPVLGQAENTFNLSVPVMSSSLKQGGQTEATVGIKRAKNFDQDVVLQFADVPVGVTVEPASPKIMHGDVDTKIAFKAGDDAAVGNYMIKITGHPTKGGDAQIEFKLAIAAKDTFTLSVPLLSTSLKQGETKTVSISVKRDQSFDQDVALEFGELPTGVTMEPAAPVISQGQTEAQLTLTAADDAALGNFTIKTTGVPTQGANAAAEFKLTVNEK